jgi:hypothetical protein
VSQPTSIKFVPEHHGVHLPGKFVDAPISFAVYPFAGRVKRNAIVCTQRGYPIPIFANVVILQGDVVGARFLPSLVTTAA